MALRVDKMRGDDVDAAWTRLRLDTLPRADERRTADIAALWGVSVEVAAEALRRLERDGRVKRRVIGRLSYWSFGNG